jgi:hypothetical protein|tara:strand:- start:95 stop:436 length:342 start_codon:yes stop_codon:yes gene_type:complete
LPKNVGKTMELYMNRDNGALIGFYNTSYMTPMTNWTNFTEISYEEDHDEEGDLEDGDTLIVDSTYQSIGLVEDALVTFKEKANQHYGPWGKDGLFGFLGKSKPKGWYYLHYYE